MNKRNNNRRNHKDYKPSEVLKDATDSYFDMLNHSLSKFSKHRDSNEKELKSGTKITTHRIPL